MTQPMRCSTPSDSQDVQPLSGLHYSTVNNQPKDKHMDDYEKGAVIFLLIILCGVIGFSFPTFFN